MPCYSCFFEIVSRTFPSLLLKGYDDIVTLLLKAKAPVSCQVTEDLSTPLHKACAGSKSGHLSAVKQLLAANADVHALNKWRETPLLTAANHGQAKAVDALLRSGADPCKCTDTGWSPLSIAAYKGHDEVVRLLLEEGAPTEEDDPTLSALLQAATKGLPDTVELLLRHGADHTVTTKKGDTALSILVEQGLIDAAVEMVTEYKASIARCSRDRKKVQRARLLINLRIKQQQRDGLLSLTSDDETDDDSNGSNFALHEEDMSSSAATPPSSKKKKKKSRGTKETAEAQARAAEEALLLELEQEESQAQKHEAAVNSKRAKKKKKKERERQQKLKEEQERREREEKEAQERERLQKMKDEKEHKVRQQREKERRQREAEEAAERERVASAKRKEEEVQKRQREQAKKGREKASQAVKQAAVNGSTATVYTASSNEKRAKATAKSKGARKKNQPSPVTAKTATSAAKPQTRAAPVSNVDAVVKKRGWETASPVPSTASAGVVEKSRDFQNSPEALSSVTTRSDELRENRSDNIADFARYDLQQRSSQASGQSSSSSIGDHEGAVRQGNNPFRTSAKPSPVGSPQLSGRLESAPSFGYSGASMELPGIAIYRQEKLVEIFQRCAVARSQPQSSDPLRVVDEAAVKTAVYRWIVRAAHGSVGFMDGVIPSWTEFDLLSTFFQRQFIAESRKGSSVALTAGMVSMEALKEAGNAMAVLCHGHAEDLMQASRKLEEQLPPDWTDSILRLSASEVNQNGVEPMVLIDWANRAQVCIPMLTFAKLRDRYSGPPGRILTAIFAAKKRYELLNVLVAGTTMDYRLSPATKACAEREIGISAEVWSDPFSATCPVFCGHFPDVDMVFGGLPPFAKEGGGGEMMLLGRCGSVAALLPLDNTVASLYVRRMVDVAEAGDQEKVPISFAAILSEACFHDLNRSPTISDLPLLDPRLNDAHGAYVRFAEVLHPGQHTYHVGDGDGQSDVSQAGSLFVILQNDSARRRFAFSEVSLLNVIQSMSVNRTPPAELPIVPPIAFSSSFNSTDHASMASIGYPEPIGSHSPLPQPQDISTGFGVVGGASIMGPSSGDSRRSGRRGRLFDLVDNGEDDNFNDVDVVSGMLNNLNVDLFQSNPTQDVDIEAISLMGIGNVPRGNDQHALGPPGGSRTTSRFA